MLFPCQVKPVDCSFLVRSRVPEIFVCLSPILTKTFARVLWYDLFEFQNDLFSHIIIRLYLSFGFDLFILWIWFPTSNCQQEQDNNMFVKDVIWFANISTIRVHVIRHHELRNHSCNLVHGVSKQHYKLRNSHPSSLICLETTSRSRSQGENFSNLHWKAHKRIQEVYN